jgi:hypothetical protein
MRARDARTHMRLLHHSQMISVIWASTLNGKALSNALAELLVDAVGTRGKLVDVLGSLESDLGWEAVRVAILPT